MSVPKLTAEQRSAALHKAAVARIYRADVKQRLKSSKLGINDVLSEAKTNEPLSKMRVFDLLRSMPGVGETKAQEMMDRLGIAPSRRLRGLGTHQVESLLEEFKKRG